MNLKLLTDILFFSNIAAHLVLILGLVWCIAVPARRIYPMTRKTPIFYAMWGIFAFIFFTNPLFIFLDWNSGIWSGMDRLFIGVPLVLLGVGFLSWGFRTLGSKNTSGLRDGFIRAGAYRFSRNPQYVGDFAIFTGVTIISNSPLVMVTHLLTILVFLIGPLAEETWLEEQYGAEYLDYKTSVPRFL